MCIPIKHLQPKVCVLCVCVCVCQSVLTLAVTHAYDVADCQFQVLVRALGDFRGREPRLVRQLQIENALHVVRRLGPIHVIAVLVAGPASKQVARFIHWAGRARIDAAESGRRE